MINTLAQDHPARIKLSLLRNGVIVRAGLVEVPYVDFIFPKGIWASLTAKDFNRPHAEFELIREQEFFYLVGAGVRTQIEVRKNPDFYNAHTESGRPFSEIAAIRTNYVAILPEALRSDVSTSVSDVLEVVRKSLAGGWAEYVSFYEVTDSGENGLARALPFIKAVRRHVDTHVSLTTRPPADLTAVDSAYANGVDAVAYETARGVNFDRSEAALKHAAEIFLTASVAAPVLLDRPHKDTIPETMEKLTGIGVLPVLCYRTSFGTHVIDPIDESETIPLFRRLAVLIRRAHFKIGWIPHDSTVAQSLDPNHFLTESAPSLVRGLMRTITGSRLAFGLETIRRKLRVRER